MVVWLNLWKVSSRHGLIMPPKKNEEKFTEMLDEALPPIKEAMENLITKEMMTKLISGIEDKLVKKMIEQGREIDKLKLSNSQLEGRVAILEHLVKVQEAKYDDIEQYGRRLCLRVNDVPLTKDETSKEVEDKLKEEFINMGLNLPENAIDRAHRIGRKYQVQAQQESDDGNEAGVITKQQVIIRSFKFLDLTVDEMTSVFTTSVMDIMLRYIPNKMIRCHDKDPPWITPEIKTAIKRKHRVYNTYVRRGRKSEEWEYVRVTRNETSKIITDAKETYFASLGRKLSNPAIGLKVYWSTLNKIINKKKMTNIPPLLENGIFVTNFQTKADIFNDLFVQQCSIHVNDSVLPNFISRCNLPLANTDIDPDKVLKIIRSLDCNKAHGWDNLSIAMIKICDVGIVKPLCLIYNKCLASGTFPEIWKKGNVIPVHKKESRQLKKNYRPISLLPICGKILEKIIFDVIYKHLTDNDLLTPNQSGF